MGRFVQAGLTPKCPEEVTLSALTKVFVILVTVLSIVLVAVVVTFVANQENWSAKYKATAAALTTAKASARARQAEQQAHQDRIDKIIADLNSAQNQLKTIAEEKDAAKAGVDAENVRLRNEGNKLGAQNSALVASTQIQTEIYNQQREELALLRKSLDTIRTQLIQLSDDNSDKATKINILEKETRNLQERLAAIGNENEQLIKVLEANNIRIDDPSALDEPRQATFAIAGAVTAIEKVGETEFVQVNLGRNDGVAPNMEFIVHDGELYKATMVIGEMVDERSSVGKITLLQQGIAIAPGDQVRSGIEY